MPKVVRKVVRKVAETERKGSNSAPPHVKTKIEGKRKMDHLELTRVRKNLFCKLEEEDDNEFT